MCIYRLSQKLVYDIQAPAKVDAPVGKGLTLWSMWATIFHLYFLEKFSFSTHGIYREENLNFLVNHYIYFKTINVLYRKPVLQPLYHRDCW